MLIQVIVNDKTKRELKAGDGFGELALLYNAPRSASVKALEECYLWGIDRNTFRRAVEEMITKEYEENRKFMEVVRFFRTLFLSLLFLSLLFFIFLFSYLTLSY